MAQRLGYFVKYELLQSFSPVYFAVTMGTGGISILFDVFPFGQGLPMKIISLAVFFLNLSLFLIFSLWAIARYSLYPKDWLDTMKNPTLSLFWGCFPMGFTTIMNVAVNVLSKSFSFGGKSFLYSVWAAWWINVVISCACCWGMVHYMFTSQTHSLEQMTAAWMLPVVTLIVCSSSGGVLANALRGYSMSHALVTLTTAIFIVTVGFTLSFIIFAIYFQRLFIHGLPPGASALTVFLPLGPTGQAGFSVALIGQNFNELLPAESSPSSSFTFLQWPYTGHVLYVLCVGVAFLLWTLATMFLFFGLLAIASTLRQAPIAFTPNFWGLVFPNSVYATLTITLGNLLNAKFFRVYGAIYAAGTILLWLLITLRSLVYMYDVVFRRPLPAIALSRTPTLKVAHVPQVPELGHRKRPVFLTTREASTY